MAANKRTKAQRELDLDKLSEMRLEGKSQNEMAQALGLSQSQVSQDLKKLDARWEAAIGNTHLHKAREAAKLDRLERKFNEAWKRSLEDKETKVAEKITVGEVTRTKAVSRLEKRDGNPAFLAGALACIEKRCALIGLAAPKRLTLETLQQVLDSLPTDLALEIRDVIVNTGRQGLGEPTHSAGRQSAVDAEESEQRAA
jgi:predicted transcriptional regulator